MLLCCHHFPVGYAAQRGSQVVEFAVVRKRFFPNSRNDEEIVFDSDGMR